MHDQHSMLMCGRAHAHINSLHTFMAGAGVSVHHTITQIAPSHCPARSQIAMVMVCWDAEAASCNGYHPAALPMVEMHFGMGTHVGKNVLYLAEHDC